MPERGNGNGPEPGTDEPIEIEIVDSDLEEEHGLELVGGTDTDPDSNQPGAIGEGSQDQTVERLKEEMDSLRELYLRKLAEFDNFRKRVEREREEVRINAAADVVRELVPVMDNFDRALVHTEAAPETLRQGVEMIARQLWDTLERQGLEVINPGGEQFNPEVHEAVQRVEDEGHEPGSVVQVLGKGYLFQGRLVRPAMVAVAVEPLPRVPSDEGPDEGEAGA